MNLSDHLNARELDVIAEAVELWDKLSRLDQLQQERRHHLPTDSTGGHSMTQDETLKEFEALPLPVQMRAADRVRERVNDEISARRLPDEPWLPPDYWLGGLADQWDREDAEKARAERAVEELARLIREPLVGGIPSWGSLSRAARSGWLDSARAVLAAGYRKTDQ